MKKQFFLLVSAVLFATAGCDQKAATSPPQESNPTAAVPAIVAEKTLYEAPAIEDDTDKLTTFQLGPIQWDIYKQKSFIAGSSEPGGGSSNSTRFKETNFTLDPFLSVEQEDLEKAFIEKRQVGNNAQLWEMALKISLLPDSYPEAAAKKVNSQFAGAGVNSSNFALVRYRYLEFSADNGEGGKIQIGAFPDASLNRFSPLGGTPVQIPAFKIRGTEEFLKSVTNGDVRIWAEVFRGGFSIRQNLVNGTLNQLIQSGYYRFLTGEADFAQLDSVSSSQGGFAIGLGPVSLGSKDADAKHKVSAKSWVTRNQLRTVVQRSFSAVNLSNWVEINDDTVAQQAVIAKVMDSLLAQAKETAATLKKIDENHWLIEDKNILEDLGQQRLEKLNNQINSKLSLNRKDAAKAKGIEVTKENNFVADTDINFGSEGGVSIPRSVNLVMVDSTLLEKFARINSTFSAVDAMKPVSKFQMVYIHSKKTRQITMDGPVVSKPLEVYWDHSLQRLFVVEKPNMSDKELKGFGDDAENDLYRSWCKDTGVVAHEHPTNPKTFDTPNLRYNGFEAHHVRLLAAREHVPDNDEIKRLNLPPIHGRWPQILDDERWYLYEYERSEPRVSTVSEDFWR